MGKGDRPDRYGHGVSRSVGALIGQSACRLLACARAEIDSTRARASGSLEVATTLPPLTSLQGVTDISRADFFLRLQLGLEGIFTEHCEGQNFFGEESGNIGINCRRVSVSVFKNDWPWPVLLH